MYFDAVTFLCAIVNYVTLFELTLMKQRTKREIGDAIGSTDDMSTGKIGYLFCSARTVQ